jgi:tripartite-type tricarboxylate transporter receptor subunit TctC
LWPRPAVSCSNIPVIERLLVTAAPDASPALPAKPQQVQDVGRSLRDFGCGCNAGARDRTLRVPAPGNSSYNAACAWHIERRRAGTERPVGRRTDMATRLLMHGAVAVALVSLPLSAAVAQGGADFYKDKTVDVYVGYSAGGGYDVYARILARHLGRHIPGNPTVLTKNMPGAGSLTLANWLYNVGPKDGTAFGIIGRGTAFDPLLGSTKARFDAAKFNWIGSMNDEVSVCVAWHTTGIKTLEQLTQTELVVGGTGPAADTDQFPKVLNGVLGTKMKLVTGYPGGNDINLAMERGEVQGRCGWSWSSVIATHKAWLDEKKINVLIQLALGKHADLPNVPLVTDFAKTEEEKSIFNLVFARQVMGRPFLAPPGIPQERVDVLRNAFMAVLKDKDFLAEADKAKLEITPVAGDAVQKLVSEVNRTPKEIATRVGKLLGI